MVQRICTTDKLTTNTMTIWEYFEQANEFLDKAIRDLHKKDKTEETLIYDCLLEHYTETEWYYEIREAKKIMDNGHLWELALEIKEGKHEKLRNKVYNEINPNLDHYGNVTTQGGCDER